MYLGYQGNKIKFYTDKPLDLATYNLDRIEETNDKYMLSEDGTEYIPYDQNIIDKRELKVQLEEKEFEYNMNRWQREIILAENSGASEYTKDKAEELEDLAEQIRNNNEITNEN